jgi:hypothetical protein
MKYLLHMGEDPIYDKLNDLPPFEFLPGKATPVNDDFIASRILDHKRLEGLVEVPCDIDEEGFPHYHTKEAKELALEALRRSEDELVDRYVTTQRNFMIAKNKAPLPPSNAIAKIIKKRRIDLAAMGLNISGAGFSLPTVSESEESKAARAELKDLQKEMDSLKKMLAQMSPDGSPGRNDGKRKE